MALVTKRVLFLETNGYVDVQLTSFDVICKLISTCVQPSEI